MGVYQGRKFTVQTLFGNFRILIKEYDSSKAKFLETSFKTFLLECFSAATEGNALKFAAMVELYLSFGSFSCVV